MLHVVEVDPNSFDRYDMTKSVMLFEEFAVTPDAGDILLVNNTGPEGDDEVGRSTGYVESVDHCFELVSVVVDWKAMVWS